jgi:sulfur-oxidizing protein SoxX
MPASCKLDDAKSIERGKYFFHGLNGGETKDIPPDGVALRSSKDCKVKQYGNCVACHNIEGAVGAGNIGPDLTNYKSTFVASSARTPEFVYQKIADPRIDNPNTRMTVNLTTKLFNEQEICDLTAYIVSSKK